MHDRTSDPLSRIEWHPAVSLVANAWNPNMVLGPELRLLERSILRTGWVQPVLVRLDATRPVIIDGFHRVMLSLEKPLRDRYHGEVPCSVLNVSVAEAMMMTVRINAAKGSHRAIRMAELVRSLRDVEGVSVADIVEGTGLLPAEVERLYTDDVFTARDIANYRYSKAWEPDAETPREARTRLAAPPAAAPPPPERFKPKRPGR
jgi:hypothetical protein